MALAEGGRLAHRPKLTYMNHGPSEGDFTMTQTELQDHAVTVVAHDTAPLAAARRSPNLLDLVIRGADGVIYHKCRVGKEWSPARDHWNHLGGQTRGAPAIIAAATGMLDLFAVGTDGALYHKWLREDQWRPEAALWRYLGGKLNATPAVVSGRTNRLEPAGCGGDGAVYFKSWNGSTWLPGANDWEYLGGRIVGSPCLAERNGVLDLLVRGPDNALHYKSRDRGLWGADWHYLGGDLASAIRAIARG